MVARTQSILSAAVGLDILREWGINYFASAAGFVLDDRRPPIFLTCMAAHAEGASCMRFNNRGLGFAAQY